MASRQHAQRSSSAASIVSAGRAAVRSSSARDHVSAGRADVRSVDSARDHVPAGVAGSVRSATIGPSVSARGSVVAAGDPAPSPGSARATQRSEVELSQETRRRAQRLLYTLREEQAA